MFLNRHTRIIEYLLFSTIHLILNNQNLIIEKKKNCLSLKNMIELIRENILLNLKFVH